MTRSVQPELLDQLPPEDGRAAHSRRDLQRINWWMGNVRILAEYFRAGLPGQPLKRVIELGAGDGTCLLRLAKTCGARALGMDAVLVDRRNLASAKTRSEFERLGWRTTFVQADVFEWLASSGPLASDMMIANLFLHHFRDEELQSLFQRAAKSTDLFVACEPRRSALPLIACRFLWVLGCNQVTRHDAAISVRAGFTDGELSRLWPSAPDWRLEEGSAGMFSHVFAARRRARHRDR
jgi:hypothetical protein